jgi:hypothetical protein
MRTLLVLLALFAVGACDDQRHGAAFDLGADPFKPIGAPCAPDTPPTSQCGYPPQFYCAPTGLCASACNRDADCPDGAVCVGKSDAAVGECRQPGTID